MQAVESVGKDFATLADTASAVPRVNEHHIGADNSTQRTNINQKSGAHLLSWNRSTSYEARPRFVQYN